MNGKAENIKQKLAALRAAFAEEIPERIRLIEELWNSLSRNRWEAGTGEDMLRLVHTLAGSSASFGYSALSSAARALEAVIKESVEKGTPPESIADSFAASLEKLKSFSGTGTDVSYNGDMPASSVSSAKENRDNGKIKTVFLVEDDPLQRDNLALQIGHYGYDVQCFGELSAFRRELGMLTPAAVIMDMMFPEGTFAGADAIAGSRCIRDRKVPVIFISSRSDFNTRLQAVRAGADAYFVKPVGIGALIDKLDAVTRKEVPEPYRILVVDDDPALAEYHSALLQQAGMETVVVTEPLEVTSHLISFNPDLILMDMYMPDCNGLELAKVIRGMDTYVSIPIVFLSGEMNIGKQLTAMRMGGDDFLTKPIHPEHLISSITIRAERMRIIRSFMDRDGLTGLLNHTKTNEQLDIAVDRADRRKGVVSFAMIDIDNFKTVNDTYGHPVGDKVIVSLARLLSQRLRKTDIIGRYGGEEFAVILSDTDLTDAAAVLNDVRGSFSRIMHQSEKGEFQVTFSCGIASFPQYCETALLNIMADKALYEAKNSGRNRIVVK